MHIFYINILIFYIFYMFRNLGFISRKAVLYAVTVQYVLHASV